MQLPKIDKAFLVKVSQEAKHKYLNQGSSVHNQYLDGSEVVALAWINAYNSVLVSAGYEVVKKAVSDE